MYIQETVHPSASLRWKHTHEYYEKHPVLLPLLVAISLAAPFLGLLLAGWAGVVAGFVIGAITFLLGLRAMTKVREIREGS